MAGANPLGIIQGLLDVEQKIGSFIKGDTGGDSAIANHFRDQYRARCEEFSNAPGWLQNFPGFKAAGTIGRICKPYLDDNQWDSLDTATPFTGGQCDCNRYRVTVTTTFLFSDGSGPGTNVANAAVRGPIQGFRSGVRTDFGWTGTGGNRLTVGITARGVNWGGASPSYPGCGAMEETPFFASNVSNPTILSTTMVITDAPDGDDCGDPDPVPVPGPNPAPMPDPIRLPGDEPRPNPRNPDGLPDIPVDPFPDPIGGDGFPALPDGFGFGGGQSGGGGAGRPFDAIDNDDETGGQDEDFDDPPEGEVWVGAYLELTKVPSNITTVPGTGPENGAYFRIVGNFSIYSDSGPARLYSDSVQVRNQWTKFIGNPQGLPVNGARVTVLPGVRYRVIPVSAPEDSCRNGEE